MSLLRNTAGQAVLIGPLLLTADGTAVTSSATIKTRIGGSTASGSGTLTHISGGVWEYAPTQGETDTPALGLILEGTDATSVPLTVPTTRFPAQTSGVLPAVAAGSSGGVPLIGSSPLSNLDAAVSTRLASASYMAAPSAATVASQVRTELTTELGRIDVATSTRLATAAYTAPPTAGENADAVWDEVQSGHATAGTFGKYLDSAISGVSTGGVSAEDIADAVWDELISGHATTGTTGAALTLASDPPTAIENADALLSRNIAGGSSSGRTVKQALYALRNKVDLADGLTVYETDDTTISWTATITTDSAAEPVTGVDPA